MSDGTTTPRRGEAEPLRRLTFRLTEVAEQLGVNPRTVGRWAASGRLTSVRIRGVVLIKPDDLERFLNEHREGQDIAPRRARATRRGGDGLTV